MQHVANVLPRCHNGGRVDDELDVRGVADRRAAADGQGDAAAFGEHGLDDFGQRTVDDEIVVDVVDADLADGVPALFGHHDKLGDDLRGVLRVAVQMVDPRPVFFPHEGRFVGIRSNGVPAAVADTHF